MTAKVMPGAYHEWYTLGMLALFPKLLFLSLYSTTIIRVAVAIALLYIANQVFESRSKVEHMNVPVIGHAREWMMWVSAGATALIGIALFVGFATQAAAALGLVVAAKHFVLARRYASVIPLSRGANALLFAMCLSLIFAGAGALAFDWPL